MFNSFDKNNFSFVKEDTNGFNISNLNWKTLLKCLFIWILFYKFLNFLFFFPIEGWLLHSFIVKPFGSGFTKLLSGILGIIIVMRYIKIKDLSLFTRSDDSIGGKLKNKEPLKKGRTLYKLASILAYPGVFAGTIVLLIVSSNFCTNIGGSGVGDTKYSDIGCTLGNEFIVMVFIAILFAGLPIWIIIILGVSSHIAKNIIIKWILSLPVFLIFIYILSIILLIVDKSGFLLLISIISFIVILGKSLASTESIDSDSEIIKNRETPEGILVKEALGNIDISNIECVQFHENNGNSFQVNLDSIKRIAIFIRDKSGKTIFSPQELNEDKEFLLSHYKSKLSEKDYNLLVKYLSNWVENGGSFDIIGKNK